MNFAKLKPWNWFKHENSSENQIPVTKTDISQTETKHHTNENAVAAFYQLQTEMDRLFDDIRQSFGMTRRSNLLTQHPFLRNELFSKNYQAKLDISGDEKEYEISLELPGMSEEDISIELNGNTLCITGNKEDKPESKEKQFYRVERNTGFLQRTLSIPDDADIDSITATMKNGLLVIKFTRVSKPKDAVKRIPISS